MTHDSTVNQYKLKVEIKNRGSQLQWLINTLVNKYYAKTQRNEKIYFFANLLFFFFTKFTLTHL